MDHLCYFCLVLLCFCAHLFIDALWSPAEKGLTSWLLLLIVLIPDLCPFARYQRY